MVLTVVPVPNPAAGHDWSFKIPGQYVAKLVAVTAQLVTTQAPTTAVDASPNNNSATYGGRSPAGYDSLGPYGNGGGCVDVSQAGSPNAILASFLNASGQFDVAAFTCEAIVWMTSLGFFALEELLSERAPSTDTRFIFGLQMSSGAGQIRCAASTSDVFNAGPTFTSSAWHHVAVTQAGGTWTPYIDGVAGVAVAGHPITTTVSGRPVGIGGDTLSAGIQWLTGKLAAVSFFASSLAGANIAAHQAAIATSDAAYKAAVLADSPVALWMFNERTTHFQRTAILQVSDGTSTLAAFPGFSPTQESNLFSWNWTTGAAGASQLPDQSTTVIPITSVPLFPGYTVGTVTPDMAPGDRWQNIAIWLDETPTGGGGLGNVAYLDGTLTPQYGRT